MATTLRQVINYLQHDGWQFRLDSDSDLIVCRGQGANGRYPIEVRLSEEGHCLHLRVPRVVSVGESPHVPELLVSILELHYQLKLGRFGMDPNDGEIDCEIIVPLEDAPLSYRQFRRCMGTLLLLVDQQAPRFRSILATGRDPGRDEAQHLDRFLDQLAETLGMSRDALEARLAADPEALTPESDDRL